MTLFNEYNIYVYNFQWIYICINSVDFIYFNPLCPNMTNSSCIAKISILRIIIKKISYERRDYESVDEKSLY